MKYKFATTADVTAIEQEMPVEDRWSAETVYQQLCQTRDAHPTKDAVSFQLKSGPKDKAITLCWTDLTKRGRAFLLPLNLARQPPWPY